MAHAWFRSTRDRIFVPHRLLGFAIAAQLLASLSAERDECAVFPLLRQWRVEGTNPAGQKVPGAAGAVSAGHGRGGGLCLIGSQGSSRRRGLVGRSRRRSPTGSAAQAACWGGATCRNYGARRSPGVQANGGRTSGAELGAAASWRAGQHIGAEAAAARRGYRGFTQASAGNWTDAACCAAAELRDSAASESNTGAVTW